MSDPLPPDKLDKLLPALKHLAEMMQKSSNVDADSLELLLLGVGLEEDWAIDEVQRWKKILSSVRGQTDTSKREFAQRALILRGVPEAHAMLGVSIAAELEKPLASPISRHLVANIERLDFGVIPVGQAVNLEFEVQGGPGRIVVDSDQLEVTPLHFESAPTRIRVEVKPFVGDALWINLKLIAGGETLEIPVLALREKPPPPPPPLQSPDGLIDQTPTPSLQTHPTQSRDRQATERLIKILTGLLACAVLVIIILYSRKENGDVVGVAINYTETPIITRILSELPTSIYTTFAYTETPTRTSEPTATIAIVETLSITPTETPIPSFVICVVEDNSGLSENFRDETVEFLEKSFPSASVIGFSYYSDAFFDTDCNFVIADYTVSPGEYGPEAIPIYLDRHPQAIVIGYFMGGSDPNRMSAAGAAAYVWKPNSEELVSAILSYIP